MSESSSSSRKPRESGAASQSGSSIGEALFAWLKGLARGNGDSDLRESLEEVIEEHEEEGSTMSPEQREMLLNILSFGELQVDDVMVPRADIVAFDAEAQLEEAIAAFRKARHSRLPVYRESLDDIVGFVHIKDIIDFWNDGQDFSVAKLRRDVLVVPPSMLALDLLARMRATRIHMAIVVDEYGGVDGLVTIEDVVEEIVGDIEDEHDKAEGPLLVELSDGTIEADGRTEIEEFEDRYGVDLLPDEIDEDTDTLGGLVFALLGRVPRKGEKVLHAGCGLEFEVVEADPRRVKRLLVRRYPAVEGSDE